MSRRRTPSLALALALALLAASACGSLRSSGGGYLVLESSRFT